jgi:hypothetical protein
MDKGLAEQLQNAIQILGDGYGANNATETGLGTAGNLAALAADAMTSGRVNGEIANVWSEIGNKLKQLQDEISNSIGALYSAVQNYSLEQLASQQETLEAGNEMMDLLNSLDEEDGSKNNQQPTTVQVGF